MTKFKLLLGSASPRRKELIADLFLPFQIETSDIEEVSLCEKPCDLVVDLAEQKGVAVLEQTKTKNPLIISADTIVVLDGVVLGKPHTKEKAKEMLLSLSGRSHEVYTGVCIMSKDKKCSFFEKTVVEFGEISNEILQAYIETEDSLDKAGAYGIQKYSQGFIKKINGSYSNVVGLPVFQLHEKLQNFMVNDLGINLKEWRLCFE